MLSYMEMENIDLQKMIFAHFGIYPGLSINILTFSNLSKMNLVRLKKPKSGFQLSFLQLFKHTSSYFSENNNLYNNAELLKLYIIKN